MSSGIAVQYVEEYAVGGVAVEAYPAAEARYGGSDQQRPIGTRIMLLLLSPTLLRTQFFEVVGCGREIRLPRECGCGTQHKGGAMDPKDFVSLMAAIIFAARDKEQDDHDDEDGNDEYDRAMSSANCLYECVHEGNGPLVARISPSAQEEQGA
jgi:hypothetical protein